jgi:uncharacterized membrane protein YdjX (TVP38/TMEM64 family)
LARKALEAAKKAAGMVLVFHRFGGQHRGASMKGSGPASIPLDGIVKTGEAHHRRRVAILRGAVALVLIGILIVAGLALIPTLGDRDRIAAVIERAGVWGPLVFIMIQALQVIAAPVSGQVTGLASGFLFGPLLGTVYCAIGGTIGCTVVFLLSRKLGRPFVEAIVNRRVMQRFDYLTGSGGALALLIIFLVPIFPDDIISYIAGLTPVPVGRLVLVALFGRLPGYALFAVAGDRAASADLTVLVAIGLGTALLLVLLYWQRHRVEAFIRRVVDHGRPPFGHIKTRYKAWPRTRRKLLMLFALSNLWVVRRRLPLTG